MSAPTVTKKLAFPIFGIGLSAISANLGGPEAGAIVGSIATALNWFGGVFGNRTDALWSQPKEPDAAEVFRNHDLRALIRRAVLQLIENAARCRHDSHGKITDTLRECAMPLADAFMAEVGDPASPLHEIVVERDIPDLLAAFAQKEGVVEILNEEQCRAFLERHPLPVSDDDQELWQNERELLAEALRRDFGTSLWNLTKIDSATDGKAFAAVQMLYLSRILDAVEGNADAPELSVLEHHLDHLIQRLDEKQARWFQRLWSQAERHSEADTVGHQKTHRLLLLVLKRLKTLDTPSAPTCLHQLPPNPRDFGFIGREADLAKLRALNPSAGAHLTGLRGMGGIGKTALAVVLAHEWAARFPEAQLFLDARGTQADPPSARALMEQVVLAFHPTAKLPDDEAAIGAIYRDVLTGKGALILLDNVRDAAQAKPLIPPAGCALIVTSRQNFLLGTIAAHDVGRLPDPEATALLREYYAALTDAEAVALVKLCAGLPLALRLAGSHIALDASERGGVPDFAGYLRLLGGGRLAHLDADAADAGEVTISETLRLSEARLPEAERTAWRALGIFTASFDARAAQTVAGADAEMLSHFLRRSLLEREGAARFKVHDLAAEYACAQLGDETLAALRFAHARYYQKVAQRADKLYLEGEAVAGLAMFDSDRAGIEAVVEWLLSQCDQQVGNRSVARLLLDFSNAIVFTGALRFHSKRRLHIREAQLTAARLCGARDFEANALEHLGVIHSEQGNMRQASNYYRSALSIHRHNNDWRSEAHTMGNLGQVLVELGSIAEGTKLLEDSLELMRALKKPLHESQILGKLGQAYQAAGDLKRAVRYLEKSLSIKRQIGDVKGECHRLLDLGDTHLDLSDPVTASAHAEKALEVAKMLDYRNGEATALQILGDSSRALGDARQAIEFYEQRLVIAREIGDRRGEGNALFKSALAQDLLGNCFEAIARATAALEIFEAIEHPTAAKVRATLAGWRAPG